MATRRQAAKDATHALVLATARTLFTTKGFEAVTIRQIAGACGRSTGSIFANFPGKEALFAAAMGRPAPDVRRFLHFVAGGSPGHAPTPDLAKQLARDLYGPNG